MSLSIVMATRGRPDSLSKCLHSLDANAVGDIEVILGMDYDAPVPVDHSLYPKLNILTFLRYQSDNMTEDYLNIMARMAKGTMIMAYTDDAVMLTNGYDRILADKLSKKALFLGDTKDNMREVHGNNFTSFPVISRESIDLLGWFMFPYYRAWSADKLTYSIYDDAKLVVDCLDVVSHHNWGVDDTAHSKMKRIFSEDMLEKGVAPVDVTKYVHLLSSFNKMIIEARNKR
jgi:hypothetical protein